MHIPVVKSKQTTVMTLQALYAGEVLYRYTGYGIGTGIFEKGVCCTKGCENPVFVVLLARKTSWVLQDPRKPKFC